MRVDPLDDVRAQIVAGALCVWSPFPPAQAALDQWATAIDICGDAARRYTDRGWSCVIDAPGRQVIARDPSGGIAAIADVFAPA